MTSEVWSFLLYLETEVGTSYHARHYQQQCSIHIIPFKLSIHFINVFLLLFSIKCFSTFVLCQCFWTFVFLMFSSAISTGTKKYLICYLMNSFVAFLSSSLCWWPWSVGLEKKTERSRQHNILVCALLLGFGDKMWHQNRHWDRKSWKEQIVKIA